MAREIEKPAARLEPDVLAARDVRGAVVAVAGRRAPHWIADQRPSDVEAIDATFLTLPSGVLRAMTTPVMLQDAQLGSVHGRGAHARRAANPRGRGAGDARW